MIVDCQPCNFTADRNSVPGKLVSFGFMVYWLMASPKSSCEGFSSGGSKKCCSCVVANGMVQQQPEMLLLCSLPLAAAANSSADLVTSKSYTIISEREQIFLGVFRSLNLADHSSSWPPDPTGVGVKVAGSELAPNWPACLRLCTSLSSDCIWRNKIT